MRDIRHTHVLCRAQEPEVDVAATEPSRDDKSVASRFNFSAFTESVVIEDILESRNTGEHVESDERRERLVGHEHDASHSRLPSFGRSPIKALHPIARSVPEIPREAELVEHLPQDPKGEVQRDDRKTRKSEDNMRGSQGPVLRSYVNGLLYHKNAPLSILRLRSGQVVFS